MCQLEKIIRLDVPELHKYLVKSLKSTGYQNSIIHTDDYIYAEGTVPVLLVAHMDTVHTYLATNICKSPEGVWMSPEGIGGDDRCGIYAVLKIAQELHCHILFTNQEEVGCLGAKAFAKTSIKPDVNYIIEIDRKGDNDAVYYDCDNKDFEAYITKFGFKTATGSCSDISTIAPHIGVAAVNLSSGYYNAHTLHEYICTGELEVNITRAKQIIRADSKTKYKYVEKVRSYPKYGGYSGKGSKGYGYDSYYEDSYYSKYYGGGAWGSDKHYDGKKDTALVNLTPTTIKEDTIYWLDENDYFVRIYDKDGKSCGLESCDGYGVDEDGNIYMQDKSGNITTVTGVSFISNIGYPMSTKGVYYRESYWKESYPER